MSRLDGLATELVGDGRTPNLYFVSDEALVIAVFLDREDAISWAKANQGALSVEDRLHGEIWRV